jgi:hypothetical protein
MATIYSAPEGFDPPDITANITWKEWEKRDQDYIERLAAWVKETSKSSDPIIGKIVRFGVADGYAQYMVLNVKPDGKYLLLMHAV